VHPFDNKAVRPTPVHESMAKSSEGSATGNLETVKEAGKENLEEGLRKDITYMTQSTLVGSKALILNCSRSLQSLQVSLMNFHTLDH